MTWNDIKQRLKSPVVVFQIIVDVIAPTVILYWPGITAEVQILIGAVTVLYNIFAGLNNPTTRNSF